ncbi:MAG: hypothetical protein WD830_07210 [Chloroflexota bacterium]
MNNNRSLTRSEHRRHDRLLVTRFAMDDAYPTERDEARTLLESCAECAALAADVRLIANSMSRIPVAPRPRDFMITAEQAEQLHGSRLARWLRALATPGWATLRPVAGVALSIGLVMAVVGAGLPGMAPAAQELGDGTTQGAPREPLPVASAGPLEVAPMAGQTPPGDNLGPVFAEASQDLASRALDNAYVDPSPEADAGEQIAPLRAAAPADTTRDLLVYGGLAIALLSLALLALAVIARRYFADPLLR